MRNGDRQMRNAGQDLLQSAFVLNRSMERDHDNGRQMGGKGA
jgi:hypothetical protein